MIIRIKDSDIVRPVHTNKSWDSDEECIYTTPQSR